MKHSELRALWCQCSVVYVYSLIWLKFLLEIKTNQTTGNGFREVWDRCCFRKWTRKDEFSTDKQ